MMKFLLILACVVASEVTSQEYREPRCHSQFDYEYRVIQRLVQLEEGQKKCEDRLEARETELIEMKTEMARLNNSFELLEQMNQPNNARGSVVGFTAFMDSTKSLTSTTVFNKVLFNEGGGYDRLTGVFTCPIGGVYLFSFVGAVRGSGTMWAQIKVNGNVALDAVSEGSKADQDLQGSNMGIMNLNQGDRVWVYGSGSLPGNSNGNSNTRTSSFTGVLLYPKNN